MGGTFRSLVNELKAWVQRLGCTPEEVDSFIIIAFAINEGTKEKGGEFVVVNLDEAMKHELIALSKYCARFRYLAIQVNGSENNWGIQSWNLVVQQYSAIIATYSNKLILNFHRLIDDQPMAKLSNGQTDTWHIKISEQTSQAMADTFHITFAIDAIRQMCILHHHD